MRETMIKSWTFLPLTGRTWNSTRRLHRVSSSSRTAYEISGHDPNAYCAPALQQEMQLAFSTGCHVPVAVAECAFIPCLGDLLDTDLTSAPAKRTAFLCILVEGTRLGRAVRCSVLGAGGGTKHSISSAVSIVTPARKEGGAAHQADLKRVRKPGQRSTCKSA